MAEMTTESVSNYTPYSFQNLHEEPDYVKPLRYIFGYTAGGADLLSVISSSISVFIFGRRSSSSPLYVLLLILSCIQLLLSVLDSIDFIRQQFLENFWNISSFEFYVVYPLYWYLYFIQAWLMVLIALERWSKHRNVSVWNHMTALRRGTALLILGFALNIVQFFRQIIERNEQGNYYFHLFVDTIFMSVGFFLVPYPVILGFTAYTSYRVFCKQSHHRHSYEEMCERAKTKVVSLVAVCFVPTNSLGYITFFVSSYFWISVPIYLYTLAYELLIFLSSIDIFANAVLYLIFLPDYRRSFVDMFVKLVGVCGYRRQVGCIDEANVSYSQLQHDRDAENDEQGVYERMKIERTLSKLY